MMGNQGLEQKMKSNNDTKVRPNNNEVIITVYVETNTTSYHPSKQINPKKISRKPHQTATRPHQTATRDIYDRRAHLLAYAEELRKNANSQLLQWPKNSLNSKPRHKPSRVKFSKPVRIRRPNGSGWKYQRLVPEVDIPCNCSKRKFTDSKRNLNMMRKLKVMLRGLWNCNKRVPTSTKTSSS